MRIVEFCIAGQMMPVDGMAKSLPENIFVAELIRKNPESVALRTERPLINGDCLLLLGTTVKCEPIGKYIYGGFLMPLDRGEPIVGDDLVCGDDRCLWIWKNPPVYIKKTQAVDNLLVFRRTASENTGTRKCKAGDIKPGDQILAWGEFQEVIGVEKNGHDAVIITFLGEGAMTQLCRIDSNVIVKVK